MKIKSFRFFDTLLFFLIDENSSSVVDKIGVLDTLRKNWNA